MITRDVLAVYVADCEDNEAQTDLAGDLWAHLWPTEDSLWPIDWTAKDVQDIARSPYDADEIVEPCDN